MRAGEAAESSDDKKLAVETYTVMAKTLSQSQDEKALRLVKLMEGIVRRLDLIGKQVKIEGKYLGGEPFDWAKYAGKVVLVDFWASWCGPCRREIPNMKKNYEKYHAKGFEIVGISLDHGRKPLEDFIKEQKIPWPILYNDKGPSPATSYYGVFAIPTMILVGKDGKAVSTTARGGN